MAKKKKLSVYDKLAIALAQDKRIKRRERNVINFAKQKANYYFKGREY